MAINYPTSLDTDATVGGGVEPDAGTSLDSSSDGHPTHSGLHKHLGDAVQQLETKIGIGSATPVANRVLLSTVTGSSSWAQVDTNQIANNAVETAKINNLAVTTAKIEDDAVTAAKLHADAVTGVVVANTSDTTCNVALFESATGTLGPKTDAGITYNASTGLLSLQSATVAGYVNAVNFIADAGSTGTAAYAFDGDSNTGMYKSATNELSFTTGGNQALKIPAAGDIRPQREGVVLDASAKTYWSKSPPVATGNDSEWVSYLGYYYMARNSSTAAEKENISTDLGTHLTADMIDSVVPKMWNRKTAPGIPEIGPIADDIEDVSPFLAAHGTDADGDQILTGINKTAWMSLMTLALQDIRTRLAALEGN